MEAVAQNEHQIRAHERIENVMFLYGAILGTKYQKLPQEEKDNMLLQLVVDSLHELDRRGKTTFEVLAQVLENFMVESGQS